MHIAWEKTSRVPPWPLAAVVVGVVWLALVAAMAHVAARTGAEPVTCPMKRLIGCPCPGCGSTRAGMAILRGDLPGAITCNPLLVVLAGIFAVLMGVRLIWSRRLALDLGDRGRRVAWCTAILAVLANWGYVIWAGM